MHTTPYTYLGSRAERDLARLIDAVKILQNTARTAGACELLHLDPSGLGCEMSNQVFDLVAMFVQKHPPRE